MNAQFGVRIELGGAWTIVRNDVNVETGQPAMQLPEPPAAAADSRGEYLGQQENLRWWQETSRCSCPVSGYLMAQVKPSKPGRAV